MLENLARLQAAGDVDTRYGNSKGPEEK
jgi:hypothetical protein